MSARPIGDLFPEIVARARRLRPVQDAINRMARCNRCAAVDAAYQHGAITASDRDLLIEIYGGAA